ncbi:MAG: DUF4382 domain-containing protein [Deltaproteobacteria bacterium]|nr:DUF4382 domain-containing protein [Deltaproteobacteria bacterium]
MTQPNQRIVHWLVSVACAFVLAGAAGACSSDGDPNASTLALRLTGTGALPEGGEALALTVQSVSVHVAASGSELLAANDTSLDADGHWHTLQVGMNASLTGAGTAVNLGELSLPAGAVNQIRVNLAPVAGLVAKPAGCTLDLSAYAATGWRITKPFKPFATYRGVPHVATLGLDLSAALVPQGNCYQLQPALGIASWQTSGHFLAVE